MDELETVATARQALLDFGDAVAASVWPVMDAILKFADDMDAAIRTEYLAAGAIYGDTSEGRWRWFNERSTIAHLRAEADYMEERQAMVADFRRMVEARRAP